MGCCLRWRSTIHLFSQHSQSRIQTSFRQRDGTGAESSDSTLAEGRAAPDEVTRNILTRTSGRGYTLAGCPPARSNVVRLWRNLRHLFQCRLCETVSALHKKQPATFLLLVAKIFCFFTVLLTGSGSFNQNVTTSFQVNLQALILKTRPGFACYSSAGLYKCI